MNKFLRERIKKHFGGMRSVPKELKPFIKDLDEALEDKGFDNTFVANAKKYQSVFENSPEVILIINKHGRILDINNRCEEWLGYKKSDFINKNALSLKFITAKSKVILAENFLKRMLGQNVPPYDLVFIKKNKKRLIGRVFATPIRDEKGDIIQDLVMISDVTELTQTEENLRQSESEFKAIFENAKDLIIETDLEGNFIRLNDAVKDILGYSEKKFIGKNFISLNRVVPKKYIQKIQTVLKELAKKGTHGSFEIEAKHKNGKRKFLEIHPSVLRKDGHVSGIVAIVRDITQKKESKAALAETEKKFKDLVINMTDFVWEIDENDKYVYASDNIKKILNYSSKDLLGKTPFDFMEKDEAERIKNFFKENKEKKKPIVDLENWVISKKGELVCLLTNGIPIIAKNGEFKGYRGVDKNITERKHAEEDLKKFKTISDNANHAIMIIDFDNVILYANKYLFNLLDYKKKDLLGKKINKIYSRKDFNRFKKFLDLLNKKNDFNAKEINYKSKTGDNISMLVNAVQIKSSENDPLFIAINATDISSRKNAFDQLRRRDRTLEAVSLASEELWLSTKDSWDKSINRILKNLGKAENVSRAYIFKNFTDSKKRLCMKQINEWTEKNTKAYLNDPFMQHIPYSKGFRRWKDTLSKGEIINSLVKDCPPKENKIFDSQNILSIVAVPIFVNKKWWGFLGFDECKKERLWEKTELDSMKTAANIIGAAIQKMENEKELFETYKDLKNKNEELEKFNKLMVGRELRMIELKNDLEKLKERYNKIKSKSK